MIHGHHGTLLEQGNLSKATPGDSVAAHGVKLICPGLQENIPGCVLAFLFNCLPFLKMGLYFCLGYVKGGLMLACCLAPTSEGWFGAKPPSHSPYNTRAVPWSKQRNNNMDGCSSPE